MKSLVCQAEEFGLHIAGYEESTEDSLRWRLSRSVWTGKIVLWQSEDRCNEEGAGNRSTSERLSSVKEIKKLKLG